MAQKISASKAFRGAKLEYEMKKLSIDISDDEAVKFNEIVDKLEIFYPKEQLAVPPANYAIVLVYALWKNDPVLLMKVLDSQDINPWDVRFVEDGLGDDSQDQQTMVEFASRKSSWKCVAVLIEHYFDCRQMAVISDDVIPTVAEYESATETERIAFLEAKMRAVNKGCAAHFLKVDSAYLVFCTTHSAQYPRSARLMFEDFSKFKFGNKKKGSPIQNKRLDLRQKVLAAISAGDVKTLELALDVLKANAVAFEAAKRTGHDALTATEANTFIVVALSCNYPECVVKIMSKALEFKKAESWVRSARNKLDDESLKLLDAQDALEQLVMISSMVKDIDGHLNMAKLPAAPQIENTFEKVVFELLIKVQDVGQIDELKSVSNARLTVMKDFMIKACSRAASWMEKVEIESSMPVNNETAGMPRERVRL